MSYDVYVNLKYDDEMVRRIVDLAPRVDFFGDGETLTFAPSDFAAHNDRYRGTPEHQFLVEQSGGTLDNHGFLIVINRAGRSLALHDNGPGDFAHARETIRDFTAWVRAHVPGAKFDIASVASTDGYADYAYVGAMGGWQVTDAGNGLTAAAAQI
ncbi:MAG TPA: hypothetical protein VIC60_03390 [Thermomicrobiales bacterium]